MDAMDWVEVLDDMGFAVNAGLVVRAGWCMSSDPFGPSGPFRPFFNNQ
jgi:hypothetical protein